MSEQKLNLSHKVFAALERLIKETTVWDAELELPVQTCEPDWSMATTTVDIRLDTPASIQTLDFNFDSQTHEIIDILSRPTIHDAAVEELHPRIIDEKVDILLSVPVHNEPVTLETNTRVIDLFKRFNVDLKPIQSTTVKNVNIIALKPLIVDIPISSTIHVSLKENLFLFRRLTVHHKPVVMNYVSEREQLSYWKWAVRKTNKEPKKLRLEGVYSGIPFDYIENIKIDFSQKKLCYNFKAKAIRSGDSLKDIALFTDMETGKTVVVMPE